MLQGRSTLVYTAFSFWLKPKRNFVFLFYLVADANQAASLCLRLLKQEYFSPKEGKFKLLKPVAPETSSATKQSDDSTFEQGKITI